MPPALSTAWHAADGMALPADRSADQVIQELNARHQDYRLVEQDLAQRRVRLRGKLPEIEKAVAAVAMLLERREAGEDVRGLPQPSSCAIQ